MGIASTTRRTSGAAESAPRPGEFGNVGAVRVEIEDVQKSAANAGRTLGKRVPGDSSGSLQFSICL